MSEKPKYHFVRANEGDIKDFDWGQLAWKASAGLGNSDALTFGVVTIRKGCHNPPHIHPNCSEILCLLRGELDHVVGDETVRMGHGDTIIIPAGIPHHANSVGDQDAVMITAFSSAHREIIHLEDQ